MNKKETTAMQQLIDYIDVLDRKGLPEYTMAVAIRVKAIELLETELAQLKEAFDIDLPINQIDWQNLNFNVYYNFKYNNNEKDNLHN